MSFKKATKKQVKLRLAIQGPSGSGKTTGALVLATTLANAAGIELGRPGKVAFVDTERGSASLYADIFDFDVMDIENPHEPEKFIKAITEAENLGYDVLVVDSYSHIWQYCLETVSKLGGNSYIAWGKVTPRLEALINKILNAKIHIIACMRSKTEYILEEKGGKSVPRKAGMAAIVREGTDYEFTIVFELAINHMVNCTKDRTKLFMGKDFEITPEIGQQMIAWMNSGEAVEDDPLDLVTSMADIKKIWDANKDKQSDQAFKDKINKAKERYS
jgi:hypothetical protein